MSQKDYTATISAKISAKEAINRISRVPDWWTKGFTGASQNSETLSPFASARPSWIFE
jgi:hypothetical protein